MVIIQKCVYQRPQCHKIVCPKECTARRGIAQNLVGFRRLLPRWALKVDIFWQWIALRAESVGANGAVHAYVGPIACSHADFRA